MVDIPTTPKEPFLQERQQNDVEALGGKLAPQVDIPSELFENDERLDTLNDG